MQEFQNRNIWVKVFMNAPSKIFKGCLSQKLLCPFLNTLTDCQCRSTAYKILNGLVVLLWPYLVINESNLKIIWNALRDVVPFVQFQKREEHPWRSVTSSKVVAFSFKLTFLRECFLRFLNCTNSAKTRKASHIWLEFQITLVSRLHWQNRLKSFWTYTLLIDKMTLEVFQR